MIRARTIRAKERIVRLLGDILRHNAQVFGKKAAVIQDDARLSYRQVNERANNLAHSIRALGVKKGQCAALLARNDYRFVEI